MIRVAIADDEKNICDTIRKYIGEYVTTSDMDFEVKCFTSCEELMSAVMREDMYDLIFLDIEFSKDGGEMNGIEFGKKTALYMAKRQRGDSLRYLIQGIRHRCDKDTPV